MVPTDVSNNGLSYVQLPPRDWFDMLRVMASRSDLAMIDPFTYNSWYDHMNQLYHATFVQQSQWPASDRIKRKMARKQVRAEEQLQQMFCNLAQCSRDAMYSQPRHSQPQVMYNQMAPQVNEQYLHTSYQEAPATHSSPTQVSQAHSQGSCEDDTTVLDIEAMGASILDNILSV